MSQVTHHTQEHRTVIAEQCSVSSLDRNLENTPDSMSFLAEPMNQGSLGQVKTGSRQARVGLKTIPQLSKSSRLLGSNREERVKRLNATYKDAKTKKADMKSGGV